MDNPFSILEQRLDSIERYLKDLLSFREDLQHHTVINDQGGDTTFTAEDLAKYLGCSKPTVMRYKRNGVFPFYQAGRSFYFKKTEVDHALSSNSPRIVKRSK